MSLSQQIKESMTPTWHHMMLTLITQGVVCRCPHHKVTIVHFKLSSLEQNQSNSHLMREELSSTLWRGNNFSIRYLEFFCLKKLCFFPFICFFNHLIIAAWTYDIYFILCVLTLFFQFYITILLLFFKLLQLWPLRDISVWFLCSVDMSLPPCFFFFWWVEAYLPFQHNKMLQARLAFALSLSFLQSLPVPFCWRMIFRIRDLSTRCAHCYGGLTASRPSQQTLLRGVCMYNNPCILSYLHLFIHVSMWTYFKINEFILTFPKVIQNHRTHPILPCLFTSKFFLWQWETWPLLPVIHLLNCSTLVHMQNNFRICEPCPFEKEIYQLDCSVYGQFLWIS